MCIDQSIGIIRMAKTDRKLGSKFIPIVAEATARCADRLEWNSLTYEYDAVCGPANLTFNEHTLNLMNSPELQDPPPFTYMAPTR